MAKPKKKGRERGSLSKKQKTFLEVCKEMFGFTPSEDYVRLYQPIKRRLDELAADFGTTRMTPQLQAEYITLFKMYEHGLETMLKYCHPTMKALETTGPSITPVFNISIPSPGNAQPMINITPKEIKPAPRQLGDK